MNSSLFFRLAFSKFREEPARLAAMTLLWLFFLGIAFALLAFLPLGWVWLSLAFGPFWTGYIYYLLRWVEGDDPYWNALFAGWRRYFFPSMMAHLILTFIAGGFAWVAISLVSLIGPLRFLPSAPAFYPVLQFMAFLFVWSTFFLAFPMIADGERYFSAALQKSASLVWRRLADYIGFTTVCFLVLLAGVVTIVGILIALPMVGLAMVQAYRYERVSLL